MVVSCNSSIISGKHCAAGTNAARVHRAARVIPAGADHGKPIQQAFAGGIHVATQPLYRPRARRDGGTHDHRQHACRACN